MVERFTITAAEQDPWIDADANGQWVRYADYAALEAQLAEARKVLESFAELEAALDRIANVVGEDEPSIMWPWAQEIARSVLSPKESGS